MCRVEGIGSSASINSCQPTWRILLRSAFHDSVSGILSHPLYLLPISVLNLLFSHGGTEDTEAATVKSPAPLPLCLLPSSVLNLLFSHGGTEDTEAATVKSPAPLPLCLLPISVLNNALQGRAEARTPSNGGRVDLQPTMGTASTRNSEPGKPPPYCPAPIRVSSSSSQPRRLWNGHQSCSLGSRLPDGSFGWIRYCSTRQRLLCTSGRPERLQIQAGFLVS